MCSVSARHGHLHCLRCHTLLLTSARTLRHLYRRFVCSCLRHLFRVLCSSFLNPPIAIRDQSVHVLGYLSMPHLPHRYARIYMELSPTRRLGHKTQEFRASLSVLGELCWNTSPMRTLPFGRVCGPRALPLASPGFYTALVVSPVANPASILHQLCHSPPPAPQY